MVAQSNFTRVILGDIHVTRDHLKSDKMVMNPDPKIYMLASEDLSEDSIYLQFTYLCT
ncbi:hypothetical protein HK100_000642, partial [Physocladia obscura]